jgi:UDP-glucose 4-epimerase
MEQAMQRIAITGSSGYLGKHLIRHIRTINPKIEILGLDVAPPREGLLHEFAEVDIRSPNVHRALEAFRPDTVVHLAFIVKPMHDEARMHDINLNGSRNVCDAVDKIAPKRFLVASSATAFGPWPDNPLPIDDRWPVREHPDFSYARDKIELEKMLGEFSDRHADMAVSWVRPCIIYGPGVDNYLSRMLVRHPLVVLPDGVDVPQQYVHEDDAAAATWCILTHGGRGPYNIAPPDWIRLSDVARETGKPAIKLPLWYIQIVSRICWSLRLSFLPYPPGMNLYVRYPWIVAPNRLCHELGFRFEYSTRATLRSLLRAHRKLAMDGPQLRSETAAAVQRRAG